MSSVPLLGDRGGGATLVQLIDPLDEPEFYCVDVPGFGASLDLAAALSAHTCKPGADDELFRSGTPLPGNLQMPAYQLCMAAADAEPAANLFLEDCSDSPLQRFSLDAEGSLRLADSSLCLAVSPGAGEATGGPSHVRRDLGLQDCETAPEQHRRWQLPGPSPA
ncbi:MAG: ricin-type beta-trefoil lectin domain protein [Chloroflexi bacterium]|nr:ricin-type beta-trefoil lectin domain protein [Chloroflexota bacterium]MYC47667.1 ricin-type beta-trefoil lectin domain protein [Chloroflexota bacterium]